MNNQDQLSNCPHCGSDANYITKQSDTYINQMCFGCGYITNSLMKKGTDFFEQQMEILPELYKDLSWEDPDTHEVWFPSTINVPDKGMIFANGKSKDNWKWAVVQAVDIPEEDQHKYPNPHKKGEFYSRRMDMKTLKEYSKYEFVNALESINIF